ncbi:ABC transporter substrate-binding protein [Amphibacillus sp. Q70]|uniref:ABC transporter substrate-binding protein n=1 Tax=Amphibacillus sp. Q70 TaxID=3453416 RepID=UPI003F846F67
MSRKSLVITVIFMCLFMLSSCASTNDHTLTETNGLTNVNIQIDGAAVPYYAPLYLAVEKGYFAEQGLNVNFYYASAAEIVKNVGAGNVEFGFPNADPVILGRGNDVPIKIAHTTYQNGLGSIIYKETSDIDSPEDLTGKTIGITSYGSPNYIQLQVILQEAGLSLDDVDIRIIGTGAIVNALISDQVDAISFSKLRTYELNMSGVEVDEILSEDYLPTYGNVLITGDNFYQQHPDIVDSFVKALDKSLAYLIDGNVEEAVEIVMDKYVPSTSEDISHYVSIIEEEFVGNLWQSADTDRYGFGYSNEQDYNSYIQILSDYGLLEQAYSPNELIVNINLEENTE